MHTHECALQHTSLGLTGWRGLKAVIRKRQAESREQVATCHCVGGGVHREGFLEGISTHWKSGVQGVCGGERS